MLEKIFIKDYKNTEDPDVRNAYGNVAGGFGIVTNLILGAMKLVIGIISHSVSIMADAVNNITDMATSALTIVGFKLASKKPNRKHPYGYARYEYVSAFLISIFMLVMGGIFVKESVVKIIHPEDLQIDRLTYIILGIAVAGKLLQLIVYRKFAKVINSNALEATALDTRNDIITTTGILISMIVMGYFKINIDAYVGLAVSLLVVYSSIGAIGESLEPIIGIIPTPEQVKEISDKLLSYPVVKGIHDMVIHNYGVHNDFVTVHCEVDSSKSILDIHDEIDNIENDFREQMGISVTIHMDPVVIGDPFLDDIKAQVNSALRELDPEVNFHDFRMVDGKTHTNVIFDCVVPQEKDYNQEYLKKYLGSKIKTDRNLFFVIEVDRPYCG